MDDFIGGSVNDQHIAGVAFDFRKGVHVNHIGHIAPAQFHWAALDHIRQIFRIKSGKHHFTCSGVIGNAQSRIKQHQLIHLLLEFGGDKCGYETALAASHQGNVLCIRILQAGLPDADLASYQQKFGIEKLKELMDKLYAVKELQLLRGDKRSSTRRAELAQQFGVKPRCLYDWERKFEAEGLEGLMDKTMRSDKGKSRSLCLLAQDRINYLYMAPGKLSQNRVHTQLLDLREKLGANVCEECCHNPESYNRADMIARGQDPGEECKACGRGLIVPESRCAINRYVSQLDPAVVALGRYGEKYFDDLYMPKTRRDKPDLVNTVWFGDHHVFDVFVDVGSGKAARPWLTAWMDACSGCIVGWAISLNPNSDTIVESLALGIARTKGSPFWGLPEHLYIRINAKQFTATSVITINEEIG